MRLRGVIVISAISLLSAVLILAWGTGRTKFDSESGLTSNRQETRPPDLSAISPREAADRLFNRVMSASERRDKEEAERFAPMAVQAYSRAGRLDADDHFHLGLIYLVLEDFTNVIEQAQKIKSLVPDHLLAIFLEYQTAILTKNKLKQEQVAANFRAAFAIEIVSLRPEYTSHQNSIERLQAELMPSGPK